MVSVHVLSSSTLEGPLHLRSLPTVKTPLSFLLIAQQSVLESFEGEFKAGYKPHFVWLKELKAHRC